MSTVASDVAQQPAEDFTRSWRYKAGIGLFTIGHLILVLGLVSPMLGLGAGVVSALVVGGEVIALTSIVFLGKEGFKAIKAKLFGFLKAGYAAEVGRTRHRIGVVLLCTNVLTLYVMMIYAWAALELSKAEVPVLEVWGMSVAEQSSMVFWLFLIGELSFLAAIYVLGADWWGRFRALFIWKEAQASA